MPTLTDDMKAALVQEGYVVVKARTYRDLQERARIAEARAGWETDASEQARKWAGEAFAGQRRLADRLTFVYGEARAAGCSIEQLS